MQAPLPYANLVGSQNPLALLASTPDQIAELVQGWDDTRWFQSIAPGKWTASQIILHLAHDEIGWCNRIRLAMVIDDYVIQPYDGAQWVDLESPTQARTALNAYLALRRLNMILFERIPLPVRERSIAHPELGEISIDWMLNTLAGHDLRHLQQLRTIASL